MLATAHAMFGDRERFIAETEAGRIRARRVVACTGAYTRERRPAVVEELDGFDDDDEKPVPGKVPPSPPAIFLPETASA